MSVCFELYSVNNDPNLKIIGFDNLKNCDYICNDGNIHDYINLTYSKGLNKIDKKKSSYQFFTKIAKKFTPKYFNNIIPDFPNYFFYYLIVECLYSGENWNIFNQRFYKRKSWVYFATTKKQLERFLDKYFNYKIPKAIEVKYKILKVWEAEERKGNNNLLFRCSW